VSLPSRRVAFSVAVPLSLTLLALGALGVLIDHQAVVALSSVAVEAVGPAGGVVSVAEAFPVGVARAATTDRVMAGFTEALCGGGRTMLSLGLLSAVLNASLLTTTWGVRLRAAGVATR
jgi:hypothetical protein